MTRHDDDKRCYERVCDKDCLHCNPPTQPPVKTPKDARHALDWMSEVFGVNPDPDVIETISIEVIRLDEQDRVGVAFLLSKSGKRYRISEMLAEYAERSLESWRTKVHEKFGFVPAADDPKKCDCGYCRHSFEDIADHAADMEMDNYQQGERLKTADRSLADSQRRIEELEARLVSAKRLQELTLDNEINWMRRHSEVENECARERDRANAAEQRIEGLLLNKASMQAAIDVSRERANAAESREQGKDAIIALSSAAILEFENKLAGCYISTSTSSLLPQPPAQPSTKEGDTRCQQCGRENPVWFAPNDVWNRVVPVVSGVLCPNCFMLRDKGTTWIVSPEDQPSPKEGE
jgi:hypothetical protein